MKNLLKRTLFTLVIMCLGYSVFAQRQEVTNGLVRNYSIDLARVTAPGGVVRINWEIVRQDGNPLEATILSTFPDLADKNQSINVTWNGTVGDIYFLKAILEDGNGCFSEAVSQEVIILPANGDFMFADAIDLTVCSFNGAAETKSFDVTYAGVKPWKLYYRITDKDGVVKDDLIVKDAGGADMEFAISTGTITIDIDDFFVNNETTDQNWTVELIKAVSVADGHETVPKGANLIKTITVHQLPVINGGITLN